MQHTITVKERQNLLDIALKTTGSIESLFDVAMANGNISITDLLEGGAVLKTTNVVDDSTLNYWVANNIEPATSDVKDGIGGLGVEFLEYPEPEFIIE